MEILAIYYTKQEAAELRAKIINSEIVPKIKIVFDRYPQIRSAMCLVAQYWDDYADDAVHYELIFSVLPTPALGIELVEKDGDTYDPVNLPRLPSLDEIDAAASYGKVEDAEYAWDYYENVVVTFAAYCKEGGSQNGGYEDYSPYAVFRRKDEDIEIEVVGTMLRPWLDGIRPEIIE